MNVFRAFAYIAVALDGGSYDADSTNMLDAIHTSIVTLWARSVAGSEEDTDREGRYSCQADEGLPRGARLVVCSRLCHLLFLGYRGE